jgi:hypothetical protein
MDVDPYDAGRELGAMRSGEVADFENRYGREYELWRRTLPRAEHGTLGDYQGTGYTTINRACKSIAAGEGATRRERELLGLMDNAIASAAPLPREITTVWRGMKGRNARWFLELGPDAVGKSVQMDYYASTSLKYQTSLSFAGGLTDPENQAMIRIKVPPGVKAPYLLGGGGEFVLPRGAKVQITKIHQLRNGAKIFECELTSFNPLDI